LASCEKPSTRLRCRPCRTRKYLILLSARQEIEKYLNSIPPNQDGLGTQHASYRIIEVFYRWLSTEYELSNPVSGVTAPIPGKPILPRRIRLTERPTEAYCVEINNLSFSDPTIYYTIYYNVTLATNPPECVTCLTLINDSHRLGATRRVIDAVRWAKAELAELPANGIGGRHVWKHRQHLEASQRIHLRW
jgi:hypothetical protein